MAEGVPGSSSSRSITHLLHRVPTSAMNGSCWSSTCRRRCRLQGHLGLGMEQGIHTCQVRRRNWGKDACSQRLLPRRPLRPPARIFKFRRHGSSPSTGDSTNLRSSQCILSIRAPHGGVFEYSPSRSSVSIHLGFYAAIDRQLTLALDWAGPHKGIDRTKESPNLAIVNDRRDGARASDIRRTTYQSFTRII